MDTLNALRYTKDIKFLGEDGSITYKIRGIKPVLAMYSMSKNLSNDSDVESVLALFLDVAKQLKDEFGAPQQIYQDTGDSSLNSELNKEDLLSMYNKDASLSYTLQWNDVAANILLIGGSDAECELLILYK